MLSRTDLHDYQLRAVDFIKRKKRCNLWLGLGMGKTASTLTAISDLLTEGEIRKVLIIAPLRVANSVWHTEVSKWAHLRHLQVVVCTGGAATRLARLRTKAQIYVINRENVPWLIEQCNGKFPFNAVVVDESTSFKSAASKRFKALKKALPRTEYMVLLTGSPAPKGIIDLWSQMFLVDKGAALGRTITAYRNRFFDRDYFGFGFSPKIGSSKIVSQLISPHTISMMAEDYLQMPKRIDLIEWVEHSEVFMAAYDQFERDSFARLKDGQEIEALSAGVLAGKLLQWSNGATYLPDGSWKRLSDAKLDALEELVEHNADENLLVAYNFKFDLAVLQARFPNAVTLDTDPTTIDRWNSGSIKMLFAHPASAGHGLNLQHGGSVIVWYGLNWNLEYYQQFNGRLYRQGQTKPVRIIHLVAKGCLDERVMQVLEQKDATQQALINALKAKVVSV